MIKVATTLIGVIFLATGCATPPAEQALHQQSHAAPIYATTVPKPTVKSLRNTAPTHLLFIGNSYLYYGDSVHNHVSRLVEAAQGTTPQKLSYKSATVGGASLSDHNIDFLLNPESLRVSKPYDAVILQGHSAAGLSEENRQKFANAVAEYKKKIERSGGETVLYMTPAYVEPHTRFRPGMIENIASLYVSVANDNDALVIPVGLAFEEAYRRRPDLALHKFFDGSHPSLAGTYLAAATVYASLYGTSLVGNPYNYFGAIDADTVLFLQTVAQDIVDQFYERS